MHTAETIVTFEDCTGELRHMLEIRKSGLRELIESKKANRMTKQAAHVALAKFAAALEILEEIRAADGVAARLARRPRTVKTVL